MKISKEWLAEKRACREGCKWFNNQTETDAVKVLVLLVENKKLAWANWLVVRVMERKQYIDYAIYASEQVIEIFEKKYPDDKRPRNAIEAAKRVLESDTKENRAAASAAASYASASASASASAAASAAAYAAAYAASDASAYVDATYAASDASAYAAAYAASDATSYADAGSQMKKKIIIYGISMLGEEESK